MKTKTVLLAFFLCGGLFITSCDKDDYEPETTEEKVEDEDNVKSEMNNEKLPSHKEMIKSIVSKLEKDNIVTHTISLGDTKFMVST